MRKNDDQFIIQLRKGIFELVILLLLRDGRKYGYEITQILKENAFFQISTASVYPVLNRLLEKKWVDSIWEEKENRMRRYYRLTELGISIMDKNFIQFKELYNFLIYFKEKETVTDDE
ncbi:PadR family transcriptional regulator [Peribacillus sp. NPDC097225]|uniref:PadR family transcriptional regulator n=1 Tax=Peribacillus sp. NPDC097225 TaxID=3364400 RepID=UPI0037FF0270